MKFTKKQYPIDTIVKAIQEYRNSSLSSDEIASKYGIYRNAIFYHRKKLEQSGGSGERELISKEAFLKQRKNKLSSAGNII